MNRQSERKPSPSLVDWPSAPAAGNNEARQRRRRAVSAARHHPAAIGVAWLLAFAALFILYAASWRYFPY